MGLIRIPPTLSGFNMVFSSLTEKLANAFLQYLLSLGKLDTSEIMECQLWTALLFIIFVISFGGIGYKKLEQI